MARRREWTRETLAAGVRAGDQRALARAITLVENSDPLAYEVVRELYPETGHAYAVGITGPPGVGKSTLISALVRQSVGGPAVGVVSVDPSSPFTQGALLGDRIRLADHFLDPEVFIRSMGTRGHLGGVAETTLQAMLILDAAGKDILFLETVGAGQSEVEVIAIADTVVLVLMPGSGDSIQALKAGIMEIPDVIAINKSDHPAAKTMMNEVRSILSLDHDRAWGVPIVLTEANSGVRVPSSGSRSRRTARSSKTRASWRSGGGGTSPARCSRSRRAVPRRTSSTPWPTTPSCGGSSTRCRAAGSTRSPQFVRSCTRCSRLATETALTLSDIEAARQRIAGQRACHAGLPVGDLT